MFEMGVKVMEKIETFNKEYEDMLEEYLENIKGYLKNNNEKYAELQNEYNKILEQNENLTWVLEGDIKDRSLSNEEIAKVVGGNSKTIGQSVRNAVKSLVIEANKLDLNEYLER